MENRSTCLAVIWKTAVPRSAGIIKNPYLAEGFLMGSSLLGLLVIIGAFWYHRSNLSLFKRSCAMAFTCRDYRLMGVQVVYSSVVTLLFMDALNLIMTIILGASMVTLSGKDVVWCDDVKNVWFHSRWFGMIIHLLNSSLCIDHLRQPLNVIRVHIINLVVSVVIFIVVPLYLYIPKVAFFTLAAFMFLFALSVTIRSTEPTLSPSTATLKNWIIVIAMCNFLVVYVPTFIVQCFLYSLHDDDNYRIAYVNVLIFTNLHLIFDGFLCALVLKLPSGEEQQQQQLSCLNPRLTASTTINQ